MLWKIIQSEWLKFRKSNIWLLLFISPVLATIIGMTVNVSEMKGVEWAYLLSTMVFIHGLLFLPLLTGVFSAFVARYEHQSGGWKQLLALPVSRGQVFLAKGIIVMTFLAITQILFYIGWIVAGTIQGIETSVPYLFGLKSVFFGWLACLPLVALQLWISTAWTSFAAPLAINVILTIPNILVANSEKFSPYYPWVQPFLTMLSAGGDGADEFFIRSLSLLLSVIFGSFLLFLFGGLLYFQKKAV